MPNKGLYDMSKVITDKRLVAELLTRGVENVYPSCPELEKKLLSGARIRLYCGYDPSAPALHIGNAISINKLAQFQALGHEVIFLIGDFTGRIGDPTDKKAARQNLTAEEVTRNARDYKRQASAYLKFDGPNPARVEYNSTWQDKLNFSDLIELSAHFTVQQMITRDMFQERLKAEKPIYLHEFLYPLVQAYDSVFLDVDLEIGGNDQMFNMMAGRDLLKEVKGKDKFVLTMKLLTDAEGKKMGKSEGNIVFLDEIPNDMYGQIMSWPDGVLVSAFELCTNIEMAEIKRMSEDLKKAKVNPRDLKMRLALEITRINHGEAAAKAAEENFVRTIQKKEAPAEIKAWRTAKAQYNIVDLLVETKLAASKSEARRLLEQGAIKMKRDGAMATLADPKEEIAIAGEIILQRGKLQFIKIVR
jgi:tyrosyl-tRNA synthetase